MFPVTKDVSCLTRRWCSLESMTDAGERDRLIHLCSAQEWDDARAAGRVSPSPAGFVHLSTPEQVHLPANRLFAGRPDMVALLVDLRGLDTPLRWEPGVPGDPAAMLFPHLYGPLPVRTVVAVQPYRPGPDGRFGPFSDNRLRRAEGPE